MVIAFSLMVKQTRKSVTQVRPLQCGLKITYEVVRN